MKIRKPKDKTATIYYFELKRLGKLLGQAERARKKSETALEKALKELDKAKEKLKKQDEEIDNLKNCRKSYANMIFKGKTKKVNSPKRGQKKGHPGVSRSKPKEEFIQEEIDVKLSHCPGCGEEMGGCRRSYERRIEDIIIQPRIEIKRYWIYQYECQHCGISCSGKSKDIIGQSPFGKTIFATVLFYKYRMKTSIGKIIEALREIHGLEISKGGIQNLLYQASVQFGAKYEQLKQKLIDGEIIYADETTWRINGEKWWTWLWCNDEIVIYTTENSRGQGIPQKMLKTFKGLLNRDGCDSYHIVGGEQQICWVHMSRKAHEYCEREKSSKQMVLLKDTLKRIYHRMNKWHKKKHSAKARLKYHNRQKNMLIKLSQRKFWRAKDVKTFIKEWLVQHKNRLTPFLKYPKARPENNEAERVIRGMVDLRKSTGGSKSEIGAKATDINMSIIETWLKQGFSIMQDLPVFGTNV